MGSFSWNNMFYQSRILTYTYLCYTGPEISINKWRLVNLEPKYPQNLKKKVIVNKFVFRFASSLVKQVHAGSQILLSFVIMLVLTGCCHLMQAVKWPIKDVSESRWWSEDSRNGMERDLTALLDCFCVRTPPPSLSCTSINKWMLYWEKFEKWEMGVPVGGTGEGNDNETWWETADIFVQRWRVQTVAQETKPW